MGGAGFDIAEGKLGAMYLREKPDTYMARVVHDEHKYSTSRIAEVKRHRVLFDTGKATISGPEEADLKTFVESAAKNYQRPGVYHTP
jgi:hypothetical protein